MQMNCIGVQSWHPLICPQRMFQDREGSANAYVETNPSMYVSLSGEAIVLVRQVNYRKFCNKSFKLGENKSISKYHIFRGTYCEGEFTYTYNSDLQFINPFPVYPSYWLGAEDLRFVDKNTVIATYPELNPGGNPRMVLGTLDAGNTITFTQLLEPSQIEKNWMPFYMNGFQYVIYSISPLIIKGINTNIFEVLHKNDDLAFYHGSTNGIPYGGGYLFLIHKYTTKTGHRWLYVNFQNRTFSYSESFAFFQHSYIEFPCSLVDLCDDNFAVSLGVNDDKAFIATVDPRSVQLGEAISFEGISLSS